MAGGSFASGLVEGFSAVDKSINDRAAQAADLDYKYKSLAVTMQENALNRQEKALDRAEQRADRAATRVTAAETRAIAKAKQKLEEDKFAYDKTKDTSKTAADAYKNNADVNKSNIEAAAKAKEAGIDFTPTPLPAIPGQPDVQAKPEGEMSAKQKTIGQTVSIMQVYRRMTPEQQKAAYPAIYDQLTQADPNMGPILPHPGDKIPTTEDTDKALEAMGIAPNGTPLKFQQLTPSVKTEVQKKLVEDELQLNTINNIHENFDPQAFELNSKWTVGSFKALAALGLSTNKQDEILAKKAGQAQAIDMANAAYMKVMSGQAVSEPEMVRIQKRFLSNQMDPVSAKVALQQMQRDMREKMQTEKRLLEKGIVLTDVASQKDREIIYKDNLKKVQAEDMAYAKLFIAANKANGKKATYQDAMAFREQKQKKAMEKSRAPSIQAPQDGMPQQQQAPQGAPPMQPGA